MIVAIALLAGGCRTAADINAEMTAIEGKHINYVITSVAHRAPDREYEMTDKGKVVGYIYEWEKNSTAYVPGVSYQRPTTSQTRGQITDSYGNSATYTGTTTTYETIQTAGYSIPLNCARRLVTNADKIVVSWSWQGNSC
jgi:hypothetical protein